MREIKLTIEIYDSFRSPDPRSRDPERPRRTYKVALKGPMDRKG